MSDASLSRRSPRLPVSLPKGGSNAGRRGGGGSHLKPPELGSWCKRQIPIRRAPQEDIDDSPPPGRDALFWARGWQLPARWGLLNPGSPATSCPRSPNPSPGHGQGTSAPLRGLFCSVLVGGRGKSRERREKRSRDYRPQSPPTLSAPPNLCAPGRSLPSRARRAGTQGGNQPGSPRAPPRRARSLASRPSVPLRFSWAPQLAPPSSSLASLAAAAAEIFPQCNCRGRSFLAYGSRRCPIRRGGGGGQVGGGRGRRRGRLGPGERESPAAAGSPPRQPRRPAHQGRRL